MLYRHKKRRTTYRILSVAKLQLEGPFDDREVVVYQDVSDGTVYTRLKDEFFDGRFEQLVDPIPREPTIEMVKIGIKFAHELMWQSVSSGTQLVEAMWKAMHDVATGFKP